MNHLQDRKKKALFAGEEAGGTEHEVTTRRRDKRGDSTTHSEQSRHLPFVSLNPYALLSTTPLTRTYHFQQAGTPSTELSSPPPHPQLSPPPPSYTVSAVFHRNVVIDDHGPDIVLASTDAVLFYAHSTRLLDVSWNAFNGLVNATASTNVGDGAPAIMIKHNSEVFDTVLHAIYSIPNTENGPTLESLLEAVSALKTYGVPLDQFVVPSTPLYDHIVAEMPRNPLEVFLVAAENDLQDLAVAASRRLYGLDIPAITDEMAVRMGSPYMIRLVRLQAERLGFLRALLLELPRPHAYDLDCGFVARKELERAWALASASVFWDAKAGTRLPSAHLGLPSDAWYMKTCLWVC